jgi:hypothetical protein
VIGGLVVIVVVAASTVLSLSCDSSQRSVGALAFDWKRGTYEGLRLGDRTAELRRVLGSPVKRGASQPFEPIGEDFYEIGGLTNFKSPAIPGRRSSILRYRRRVFLTTGGLVTAWGTTDARAETPEGVGIGDAQALVERRYPEARCFVQNEGTEYATYPLCKVRVCAGRLLGFGGEPIRSIWLAAETKRALTRCREP